MGKNHSVSFPENSIDNNCNLIPVLTLQIGLGDLDGDCDKDIIGQNSVWINKYTTEKLK